MHGVQAEANREKAEKKRGYYNEMDSRFHSIVSEARFAAEDEERTRDMGLLQIPQAWMVQKHA